MIITFKDDIPQILDHRILADLSKMISVMSERGYRHLLCLHMSEATSMVDNVRRRSLRPRLLPYILNMIEIEYVKVSFYSTLPFRDLSHKDNSITPGK